MPRISVDPTKVKTAPKFRTARVKFNWPPHHFLGFLCAFWGMVADNNETGEISDWTPEYLAEVVGIGNVDPNELWEVLVENGYIEQRPDGRVFVQDWLEMMEEALRRKYHNSDPQRLLNIWALYGRQYGREKPKKAEGSLKEREPEPPESDSFPQGSKQEVTPRRIIKEPPKDGEEEGEGNASFSPSWETEGKKEAAPLFAPRLSRIPIELEDAPQVERRDDKTRHPIHVLMDRFKTRLSEELEETVPFSFEIWGAKIKALSKDGFSYDEVGRRFENWLASTDPYIRASLTTPGIFYQKFPYLKAGPISNRGSRTNARQPFDDGAATVRAGPESNF